MGVKSLWDLLTPVGRPVMLETMEGKTMAIDSSIWIYQFQATMRAKDGQVLTNAHVLGFLRRICKLMFYGMKPVFVFDGGAPDLKRNTLRQRREKKSGAAESHAKLAQKLLAAQLRREALNHVNSGSKTHKDKGKDRDGPVVLDDDTVYLEDIDSTMPKSSPRKPVSDVSPSKPKRGKFYDHDPYRLPEVDVEQRLAQAARSNVPDPRLATEDELRSFIEDMRPEDFDVTSPAFLELPTEVQYEIIGDLRLKSRQTSYTRLQQMLRFAPTPLDFSKQQIKNLRQRNTLTQQLLATTDSIGKAHIAIPVRIASERNKEYVLMKNEGEGGGWILGIRDDGTQEKPIVLDHEAEEAQERAAAGLDDEDDDDEEMEEVSIPVTASYDPDLRELQRENAFTAAEQRSHPIRKPSSRPLFLHDDSDSDGQNSEDERVAIALQRSLDDQPQPRSPSLDSALYDMYAIPDHNDFDDNRHASTSKANVKSHTQSRPTTPDRYSPTPFGTVLSFANTTPSRPHVSTPARPTSAVKQTGSSTFGAPVLLATSAPTSRKTPAHPQSPVPSSSHPRAPSIPVSTPPKTLASVPDAVPPNRSLSPHFSPGRDEEMVHTDTVGSRTAAYVALHTDSLAPRLDLPLPSSSLVSKESDQELHNHARSPSPELEYVDNVIAHIPESPPSIPRTPRTRSVSPVIPARVSEPLFIDDDEEEIRDFQDTREPSPVVMLDSGAANEGTSFPSRAVSPERLAVAPEEEEEADWDAAQEMNPDAEEGEFARFISGVKGRDLADVRKEIDEEILSLNKQRTAAMRDAEDISQQMIHQIMTMLRLFGIPYITAPMEAEAQCAELVMLGLVDGIITDDSDVFLFGGERVFKNMFNQSKTVECFLSTDLTRELGLDRGTLVRLAYLLGSDYVEGLPGVGPVVAMELLKEFPGDDGLHKFKDWWIKVQTGKDREEDTSAGFRRRFKKKFKDLYLTSDWPNPTVRDAYYHPAVDESEEPFKWGLPDLDGLRGFFYEELGWGQSKVDDLLVPIIQKSRKRSQAAAINQQGILNGFFDISGGSGTLAPRRRKAYASKRLQQVVSDFRKKRKAVLNASDDDESDEDAQPEAAPPKKKKAKKTDDDVVADSPTARGRGRGRGRGRARGRGRRSTGTRPSRETGARSSGSGSDLDNFGDGTVNVEVPLSVELRPRPKPTPLYKGTA